ncbi:cation-translocating P-type ATPase [Nocardia brasiliensis]|uniref:cation-translocating P-type ATPase n=1 Tax=Nocardia brasiliensis TaxID=37326 RepID=UPI002458E30F|nr:cation-translocating P-type ATPase [Nocardia brasiliensis]
MTAVSGALRRNGLQAAGMVGQLAVAPLQAVQTVTDKVADTGRLRDELATLVDPHPKRSQRRVAVHDDRATIEVRGLDSAEAGTVARTLDRQLRGLTGVRWWQVNAVTGRVVATLARGAADLPELLAAVERVERATEVAGHDWDRARDHPADREPLLAAGIQVAGEICAIAISMAGVAPPLRPPLRAARALASIAETQPRVRGRLEQWLGRTRTDLALTLVSAVGTALGERATDGIPTLLLDTAQRALLLAEAITRRSTWQSWEAELVNRDHPGVAEPLPPYARPADLPPGPIEQVADETGSATLLGAAAMATLGDTGDAVNALVLGAPKAARGCREAYAATVTMQLARAGVLTLDPMAWRRLDRVTALLVEGETLLTERRVVLDAESTDPDWSIVDVWSAAQRLLWSPPKDSGPPARSGSADPAAARLVHPKSGTPDRGATVRPARRELRVADRCVGRVRVGREPDPQAHALLSMARRAGLRVTLAANADAAELRSLVDEFVPSSASLSKRVHELQGDGHVVAVLGSHSYKALARADVAIGLLDLAHPRNQAPWTADALCRNLSQVQRVVATIPPARQVSARGRSLALSASALSGLLLAVSPRSRTSPMAGAHFLGLVHGSFTAVRALRTPVPPSPPVLLPWHALQPEEALARLPHPAPVADRAPAAPGAPAGGVARTTTFLRHLRTELADPLTPILSVGAVATAILGSPSDAVLLSSVLAVNAVVSARQRQRAESALHTLLDSESLTARVLDRDEARAAAAGETRLLAGQLEVGDVLVLRAGEVVPADARLLEVDDLEMDESGLTGESVTVQKQRTATPGAAPGDRACMVYEGSTVVNGAGRAVVVAVGANTQVGRASAGVQAPEKGGVQAQLRELTDRALPLTLTGGAIVSALGGIRGRTLRGAIADGVAVAVSAVPEGLPLVATVAQLAAARRLSRYGVLVRASRTVEALGRVDTLCFDKTGTLTEGRLRLTKLADLQAQWDAGSEAEAARRLLRTAARACPDASAGPVTHATDRAVLEAAAAIDDGSWQPIDEIPFDSNRGYAAALGNTTRRLRLVVKGAPEVVLPRCTRVRADQSRPLAGELRAQADAAVRDLAEQGLRVLAVAHRDLSAAPDEVEDAVGELTLLGFLGIADTPRPQAPPLVTALQDNEISVRIITGDHPVTAVAAARQLGIAVETAVTGADLDRCDETARAELIERSTVFARVDPEQKVRIVTALRRNGHVVGMTGDGSNDAAAIRSADIGIGLAAQGSTAARNAADLVLTDPDPTAILHAMVEGRGMWRRITDAVGVLVGGNAGEVAFTLFGTAVGGRGPLGTRQFLLVNMLTDMFPALALALAPDHRDVDPDDTGAAVRTRSAQLAEIPRASLGDDLTRMIATRGIATACGASLAWTIGRYTPGSERRAATIGLVALIGTQLGQTLVSGYHSPLVWLTTAASAGVLGAVVMTPGLCTYFGCTPLGPFGWAIATGSAAAATLGATLLPALLPGADRRCAAANENDDVAAARPRFRTHPSG